MRFRTLLFAVALLAGPMAHAADSVDVMGGVRGEVTRGESAEGDLRRQQEKLVAQSQKLAAQIEQMKAQPESPARDEKVKALLAEAQAKAQEIETIAAELRTAQQKLVVARQALVRACDQKLATGNLPDDLQVELTRLRAAQVAALVQASRPVTLSVEPGAVAAQPLDGPRELEEKADLLRDSSDKLRRESKRIAARVDDLERRRHLRERSSAIDEDWFSESTSNRRFARTTTTTPATAGRGGDSKEAQNPGAFTGNGAPGVPSSDSVGGSSEPPTATVLRNLVDPATLDELRRADRGDDLDRQIRALRRAQGELDQLAGDIDKKVKVLSKKAQDLKKLK